MLLVFSITFAINIYGLVCVQLTHFSSGDRNDIFIAHRKWQDYVYIQCEYKSTKQKIKHLLREENKVKENKIS